MTSELKSSLKMFGHKVKIILDGKSIFIIKKYFLTTILYCNIAFLGISLKIDSSGLFLYFFIIVTIFFCSFTFLQIPIIKWKIEKSPIWIRLILKNFKIRYYLKIKHFKIAVSNQKNLKTKLNKLQYLRPKNEKILKWKSFTIYFFLN